MGFTLTQAFLVKVITENVARIGMRRVTLMIVKKFALVVMISLALDTSLLCEALSSQNRSSAHYPVRIVCTRASAGKCNDLILKIKAGLNNKKWVVVALKVNL